MRSLSIRPEPGTEGAARELAFTEAFNEAMRQEMAGDDSVFLMGEDVGATGGIFQVSKGLMDEFGEDRVRDTPISEATLVSYGVGRPSPVCGRLSRYKCSTLSP